MRGGNSAATASNAGSGNSSSSSNTSNGSNNSSSSSSASSNSNSSSSSSASSSGNNTTTTSNSSSRDSSSLKSKNKKVVAKIASNQRGTSGAYKKTTGECYNPNFSPTALLCDDLSKGGWKVVFDSGVVYGKSMCSTTSGNKNGETTTIDESGEGSNCWCNVGGSWVFNINYGLPGNCDNCPYACSYDVFYIGTYRDVLFGTLLN